MEVISLEIVTKITLVSHSGFSEMWYPFSFVLDEEFNLLRTETDNEMSCLLELITLMFSTTNHRPELVEDGFQMSKIHKFGRTWCKIRFKTMKHEYELTRYFIGGYSTEARIHRMDSNITYHSSDAIQVLKKIGKPRISGSSRFLSSQSKIYSPVSEADRKNLIHLANSLAQSVGIDVSLRFSSFEGRWMISGNSSSAKFYKKTQEFPSHLKLITNLSEAIMRKRNYGYCETVITSVDSFILNEFEISTLMNLAKSISNNEGLNLLICFNTPRNKCILDSIDTPRFSCYA